MPDPGGVIIVAALLLSVWALVDIANSSANRTSKIFWSLIVLLIPVLGYVIWFVSVPSRAPANSNVRFS